VQHQEHLTAEDGSTQIKRYAWKPDPLSPCNETSGGLGGGQSMPSRLKMRAAKLGKPLTKEHRARIIDFSNIAAVCRGARKTTRGMCFSYGVL